MLAKAGEVRIRKIGRDRFLAYPERSNFLPPLDQLNQQEIQAQGPTAEMKSKLGMLNESIDGTQEKIKEE